MNNSFDTSRCYARLISKPDNQCKRKQNGKCNFCNVHEKIWKSKGLATILNDKKVKIKYDCRLVSKTYNIDSIKNIQRFIRGFAVRRNISIRGISIYIRHKCNNMEDCMELENISNIANHNFISYMDSKGLYWGFHTKTFYNLLKYKSKNPYNCGDIPEKVKDNFKRLNYSPKKQKKTLNKSVELQQRCIAIFQKIDNLNNYTKCSWFLNLTLTELKNLYYFIFDMWNYRLNLTPEERKKYINSTPLFHVKYEVIKKYTNYYKISNIILGIFDRLLSEGQTNSDKSTAANWILSVLTLVNTDARLAFPWLYQAAYPH